MAQKLKPLGGVAQLATLFGVTHREIQMLATEGVVLKVGHGVYDVPGSVARYIQLLKKRNSSEEPDELKAEKIRLTRAKADEAEIRSQMVRGTAADMPIVLEIWADRVQQSKTKLLGIPSTFAGQLANETDPNVVRAILETAIYDSLDQLARIDQGELVRRFIETHGGDAGPAAEADGESMG